LRHLSVKIGPSFLFYLLSPKWIQKYPSAVCQASIMVQANNSSHEQFSRSCNTLLPHPKCRFFLHPPTNPKIQPSD